MKNILIINGSLRKRIGQTKKVIDLLVSKLSEYNLEVLNLNEISMKPCIGCAVCLDKGEEFCPHKDDRDLVLQKINQADVVVFACPNYVMHVTHLMKNFFDRFAFVYHRPRFFGKVFTSIITQGVYGGGKINKYFKDTAEYWGGTYVPGVILTMHSGAYYPVNDMAEDEKKNADHKLDKLIKKLNNVSHSSRFPSPSLFRLAIFRMTRTFYKYSGTESKDSLHYKNNGWFDSPYYYKVRLGVFKIIIGKLADWNSKRVVFKEKHKSK